MSVKGSPKQALISTPVDVEASDSAVFKEHGALNDEGEAGSWMSQNKDTVSRVVKILGLVALIGYSLAAFIIDFKRAKALFVIEVVVAVILAFKYLIRANKDGFENFKKSVEDGAKAKWENKTVRLLSYAIVAALVILVVILSSYESPQRFVSAGGLLVLIGLCYIFSWKRKQVKWRPVIWGFLLQFIFALVILRTSWGLSAFKFLGDQATVLLNYTTAGSAFVFSYLTTGNTELGLFGVFAFSVVPTVIFFSALVSVLYYIGALQVVIRVLGVGMAYVMGTSASESLNAAGNIFVGQTEAPLLIRPFLPEMTKSEIHAVMTGGFATIAGGVMAAYISMGVPAEHLLAASVMSAPAALAISKLIYPETEESVTAAGTDYEIPKGNETNLIEAASNGASIAVELALNICGMLIAFLALIAMLDAWVAYFGSLLGWETSFRDLCGYLFYPVAFLMGVDPSDCRVVGELLGLKVFANEFVAYQQLTSGIDISSRSYIIAAYALCGFSNFGSIGIQLGGLGPLAPSRKKDMAQVVFSAMIAGNIACFMTACIAGLLFKEQ